MFRKMVPLILVLLTLLGCGEVKTDNPISQAAKTSSDIEQRVPTPTIPPIETKEEDQGYLSTPFTIKDRQEIEETIREYFDALNRKNFGSAYDLWARPVIRKEEFISAYNNMQIEYVRIEGLQGIL